MVKLQEFQPEKREESHESQRKMEEEKRLGSELPSKRVL